MQLHEVTSAFREKPSRFILSMVPKSSDVLLLGRTFPPYDLNVPLNMLRDSSWPLVFIQDRFFYEKVPEGAFLGKECTITFHDSYPCPDLAVSLQYSLHQDKSSVDRMGFLQLLKALPVTYGSPPGLGTLTLAEGAASPVNSEQASSRDVGLRPGGIYALTILGIDPEFVRRSRKE